MSTPLDTSGAHRPTADQGAPPTRPSRRRVLWRALLGALLAAVLLYAALFGYRFLVAQLGPFGPFAAVIGAALALAVVGPWLVVHYHRRLWATAIAVTTWGWALAMASGLPERFARRYPRLARFVEGRIVRTAQGLGLTVGVVLAGAAAWFFLELFFEVAFGSKVVGIDRRLLNFVATFRTPPLDQIMYLVTYLGNGMTIAVLAAVVVALLLIGGRYSAAARVPLALIASTLFFEAVKLLVQRPRPPLEDARIVQGDFAFPSGHSTLAAAFYGTLAYIAIRSLRHEAARTLVGIAAGLLILAIGVSRIYLGVHYPSDVLAGWAAGVLWVILAILAEQVWLPAVPSGSNHLRQTPKASASPTSTVAAASGTRVPISYPLWRRALTITSAAVLLAGAGTYLARVYPPLPSPPTPPAVSPLLVAPQAVPTLVETTQPHYTETLLGHPQEPVNLIFVGTRAQLEAAFRAAGWTEARHYGFDSLAGGISASVTHQPDPAGPVTPSFLADQINALAFSQPVGKTFAQRHHIRIWTTKVQTTTGLPLWLATASFDRGFELAKTTFLPTHQIAPEIDAERIYVVTSLEAGGDVAQTQDLQLVPPEQGHNFDGDPFFTDGRAVAIWLG